MGQPTKLGGPDRIEAVSESGSEYEVDTGFAFLSVNAAPAELLKRASEL